MKANILKGLAAFVAAFLLGSVYQVYSMPERVIAQTISVSTNIADYFITFVN